MILYKHIVIKVKPIRSQRKDPWHILVQEQESHDEEKGDLTLAYWLLSRHISHDRDSGEFKASYRMFGDKLQASLSPRSFINNGALFLDLDGLEGNHIGTYLMNRIVQWLQRNCPKAEVSCVNLLRGQATVDNKVRRNKFWKGFGLIFDGENSETQEEGSSRPISVDQLVLCETWKENIEEIMLFDHLDDVNQKIQELIKRFEYNDIEKCRIGK